MKRFIYTLIVLFVLFSGKITAQDWKFKGTKFGVTGYTRVVNDRYEMKLTTIVKASISANMAVLVDANNYKNWMASCKESKPLSFNSQKKELYYYSISDFPWPLSDRDIVMCGNFVQDPKTKVVNIVGRCKPTHLPEKSEHVRLKTYTTDVVITPISSNETKVEYIITIGSADGLPAWLIDLFSSDKLFASVEKFKKFAESERYIKNKVEGIVNKE